MIEGSNPSFVVGTMGTNGTLSEQFDLSSYNSFGLLSDNATNGTLNILVSNQLYVPGTQQDNYRLLRDNAGVAYVLTLPGGASAFKESDIRVIAPYRYVRLLASIAQSATPTFTFVVKG